MKQLWRITRREFRSYFDHPTAYILLVAFLGLALYLTFRSLYAARVATLRPLFDYLPWLFAVFIPAITMRSLAEERGAGTLEWLMAQPVTEAEVVVGKFLGDWSFALVALAGTLPAALGVLLVSEADVGIVVAQYAGAALLAAAMVAIGIFASSTTRNQITAFILGATISLVLVLAGIRTILMGLPSPVASALGRLTLLQHFDSVARGVLDLRDVLYFVTVAGVFLALAYFVVARERLSARRGAYRRLKVGVTGIVAGVVVLNLLGGHIHGRLDLTEGDLFTLSAGSEQVLGGLDDVVTLKLFVSSELPPEVQIRLRDVRDLLDDFRRSAEGRVRVQELDPEDDEEAQSEARSLGVRPVQFNVMRGDEYQVKRGWFGLAILHGGESEAIPVIRRTDDLEYRLVSTIATLTRERRPRVAFLSGFGALGPEAYAPLRDALSERYDVRTVTIPPDSVPELSADSIRVVVVPGPEQPLEEAAVEALRSYMEAGGSAFVLAEGVANPSGSRLVARPVDAGLAPLLDARGVRLLPGVVYDLRSNQRISVGESQGPFQVVRAYPFWPIALPAREHLVTRGLERVGMGWARPIGITDSARVAVLLSTSGAGGRRPPGSSVAPDVSIEPREESLGRQVLAVAVRGGGAPRAGGAGSGGASASGSSPGGRMVVVGDATFLDTRFARGSPHNYVFAENAIDWLAQDEALIGIRSKDRTPPPLVLESSVARAVLKWGNLAGIPILFVLLGTWRILRRRRVARRGWPEEEAP